MKKYNGTAWVDTTLRQYKTATADIEPTIYTDGTAITSYTIKGNTTQSGTPTPSNPVEVNGVGERTENIVDWNTWVNSIASINGNGSYTATSTSISITSGTSTDAYTTPYGASNPATYRLSVKPNTTYSVSIDGTGSYQLILWKNGTTGSGYGQYFNSGRKFATITTDSETTFYTFRAANTGALGSTATLSNVMIVEGEYTAQTMPTYEPWGYKIPILTAQQTTNIYIGDLPLLKSLDGTAVDEISNGTLTRRVDSDGSVLPTPTTTQITMPSIPTTDGANSITVDTTVQPSEFTATWTGWHSANVKEWDGSDWQ